MIEVRPISGLPRLFDKPRNWYLYSPELLSPKDFLSSFRSSQVDWQASEMVSLFTRTSEPKDFLWWLQSTEANCYRVFLVINTVTCGFNLLLTLKNHCLCAHHRDVYIMLHPQFLTFDCFGSLGLIQIFLTKEVSVRFYTKWTEKNRTNFTVYECISHLVPPW